LKRILFLLVLCLKFVFASGQDDGNYQYTREFDWGINKNTNGGLIGGCMIKKSRAINSTTFRTFGAEIMNVKHPKEDRRVSPNSGNSYIFGKSNYLYALRLQTGFDKILFKKAPQQGVQITYGFAAGPTIGILAPYFVEVVFNNGDGVVKQQFDPENPQHTARNIVGSGRLFQGLGKSIIIPGVNAKVSMNFEFGTFKSNVTGFELGLNAEAYSYLICLVPAEQNRTFFTSAFITLYYGTRR